MLRTVMIIPVACKYSKIKLGIVHTFLKNIMKCVFLLTLILEAPFLFIAWVLAFTLSLQTLSMSLVYDQYLE